ncbi:MAG: class I SAM-dependent methyltransferase [Candidatus Omnitrophota bacterium]|nr:class I SAM-dependent methyltransferase [Candidatus Omnitrophota bacterium]
MGFDKIDYIRGGKQKALYGDCDVISVLCPLCQMSGYKEIYKERGVLGIVKCSSCGLIYVNPRLKSPEEAYWGDSEKYFEEARLIFEGKAKHHRDENYLEDIRIIQRYKPTGKFLDIGTNMGFFLRLTKGLGWDIHGVEPSSTLSEMARRYFGLNVKTAFLENAGFAGDFFDVITLIDVFEHLPQPKKILNEIHRILKPDGLLFIKVPNGLFNLLKLNLARITGKLKDYDIFDSYEHVVHYSQDTLKLTLKNSGFEAIKVLIGKPVQIPVWHKYVGHYYQYPSPWALDFKHRIGREFFYLISLLEYRLRLNKVGYFAPNIIAVAKKII